jgi:poly-beta-1,6-N-acetyl-D-glucosamine synthase
VRDYALGNHELFETIKCVYRCLERPWIVGGAARFAGYFWSLLTHRTRVLSPTTINRIRREQMSRLFPFMVKPTMGAD